MVAWVQWVGWVQWVAWVQWVESILSKDYQPLPAAKQPGRQHTGP
jgi:hypothetical protein